MVQPRVFCSRLGTPRIENACWATMTVIIGAAMLHQGQHDPHQPAQRAVSCFCAMACGRETFCGQEPFDVYAPSAARAV
jgi:hypothetical protein